MSGFKIRTDLAVELKDGGKKSSKIEGITVREDYEEEGKIKVTRVIVEMRKGQNSLVNQLVITLHWNQKN